MRSTFGIGELVLITGLTDRTIRHHISAGILQGEKAAGAWQFTPEQVEAFVRHPAVRPSILAKQNAAVYDFLLDRKKPGCAACVVLDLPGESGVAAAFCRNISEGAFENVQFSFDGVENVPRVILTGDAGEVLRLVNDFMQSRSTEKPD